MPPIPSSLKDGPRLAKKTGIMQKPKGAVRAKSGLIHLSHPPQGESVSVSRSALLIPRPIEKCDEKRDERLRGRAPVRRALA